MQVSDLELTGNNIPIITPQLQQTYKLIYKLLSITKHHFNRELALRTIGAKHPHNMCWALTPQVLSINTQLISSYYSSLSLAYSVFINIALFYKLEIWRRRLTRQHYKIKVCCHSYQSIIGYKVLIINTVPRVLNMTAN